MPRSMTGFSRREAKLPWGTLVWEIRSVNHRYLEPSFRLPEDFREIEPHLRDAMRKALADFASRQRRFGKTSEQVAAEARN